MASSLNSWSEALNQSPEAKGLRSGLYNSADTKPSGVYIMIPFGVVPIGKKDGEPSMGGSSWDTRLQALMSAFPFAGHARGLRSCRAHAASHAG